MPFGRSDRRDQRTVLFMKPKHARRVLRSTRPDDAERLPGSTESWRRSYRGMMSRNRSMDLRSRTDARRGGSGVRRRAPTSMSAPRETGLPWRLHLRVCRSRPMWELAHRHLHVAATLHGRGIGTALMLARRRGQVAGIPSVNRCARYITSKSPSVDVIHPRRS
jgi:hypothetical protein